MSLNKAMNATVALIEGRVDIAKEIFRDPSSDVKDIPKIQARLEKAVNLAAAKAIRNGLIRALAIQINEPKSGLRIELTARDAFFQGVTSVESLFETIAEELEGV